MTGCQVPVVAVENGSVVFQVAVGAFFSVHGDGSFRGRCSARAPKVADDIGRFDDESRSYPVITPVAQGRARMTVLRREDVQSRGASWDQNPYRMTSSPIL
jgi:hypothetical protein